MVTGGLPCRRLSAVVLAVAAVLCALLAVVHDHDRPSLPLAGKTVLQSSEPAAAPSACTGCRLSQLQALAPQAPDPTTALFDSARLSPPPPVVARAVFLGPLPPRAPPAPSVPTV